MEHLQPVAIHAQEESAHQILVPVGAHSEQVLGETAHERIGQAQVAVELLVEKVLAGVAVDGIHQHRNPQLVGRVNKGLEVSALAKAFIHPPVAHRQIAPVDGFLHVGDGHQADAVHS